MNRICKTSMVVLSMMACIGAVLGWAFAGNRQDVYPLQGNYEQHG